jgi:Tfp pilus assembly protein PilE
MMNINTLKFKFIVFNFLVVVLLFSIITIITSRTYRRFVIQERKESRIMVNNQIGVSA